jgi:hypothetical protein
MAKARNRRRRVGARLPTPQLRRLKLPFSARGAVRSDFEPGSVRRDRRRVAAGRGVAVLLGRHGRAVGSPARTLAPPVLRPTMPTSSSFASTTPRSSDRTTVELAGSATVASDRQERASIAALIGGRLSCCQPQPSWRSSVGHLADTSPSASRTFAGALPSQSRRLVTSGGSSYPGMGTV